MFCVGFVEQCSKEKDSAEQLAGVSIRYEDIAANPVVRTYGGLRTTKTNYSEDFFWRMQFE